MSQGMADDASPACYSHRFANEIFKSHGWIFVESDSIGYFRQTSASPNHREVTVFSRV